MKEIGWNGYSVNSALNPLINMGQQLFEPPDVNGWELGPGWFSSGGMLARMNFAAALANNQRFNLRDQVARQGRLSGQPAVVHAGPADRAGVRVSGSHAALLDYVRAAARGPVRTRSSRRRPQAWRISSRGRGTTSSCSGQGSGFEPVQGSIAMAMNETRFRSGRRGGVHRRLRGAVVSDRHRARPGALATQPGRPVPERRQRRPEHADSVHRSAVLRAPADAGDSCGQRARRSAPTAPAIALGLNPRLTDLRTIFNSGRLALIQRTGYPNSSRSHFQGTDIWSTADPIVAARHRLARAAISIGCRRRSIR